MFTSEPSLAQRIERMIAETPIIDPHTRIRCDQPNAPDLAALMSDQGVQTELHAVGMPRSDFDPALPADERVRRSIPFLARMRNTATSWCLFRIFRDLYGFQEPNLTETIVRELFDQVAATGGDSTWASTVLRGKANIRTVVTSLGNKSDDPAKNPENVLFMLDAHDLFCPGVAPDVTPSAAGRHKKGEYYDILAQRLGERPATTERLGKLLCDWLDGTMTGPVRFTSTFLRIEQRFHAPDQTRTQFVLNQAAHGRDLSDADVDELVRFVTWTILGWHNDHKKTVQLAVGAEHSICDGKSIPRFDSNWSPEMSRVFHHFGKTKFDLMLASDVLIHEQAVLARQFPNVYLSGSWCHNFFPSTIERIVATRVQVAPMTKVGGFLSDAPYAEWSYGKLQVVKKAMASALSKLVATGYYEEDEIPPILHQILHDTPRHLYDLGSRTH